MSKERDLSIKTRTLPDLSLFLLFLLILSFPLDIWAVFSVGGRGVKLFWIIGLLLVFVFGINVCRGRQSVKITKTGRAILIFNAVALVSMVNLFNASTGQWVDFMTEWLQLILYTLLFFAITNLNWTKKKVLALFKVWIGAALILSLYGIYQVFARSLDWPLGYLPFLNPSLDGGPFTRSGPPIGLFYRVSSVFIEPGYFASYLLSPLIFLCILWFFRKKDINLSTRSKNALLGGFVILYIAYLFAFSMAAFVALAGMIAIAFFNSELARKLPLYILAAFLILVAVDFALKPVLKDSFLTAIYERSKAHVVSSSGQDRITQPDSTYARTSLPNRLKRTRSGIEVWKKSPIIGVGLNNFSQYFPEDVKGLIHSGSVQILAEMGLLGLVAFGLIFGSALCAIRKSMPRLAIFSESVFISAFYYILWARLFHFLIAENWIRNTIWMDLTMTVLLLNWLASQSHGAKLTVLESSRLISAAENQNPEGEK